MGSRKCRVSINGETREYDAGTPYRDIAEEFQPRYEHEIVLVFVGENRLQELRKRVEKDCELRFVTTGDPIGHEAYKRSMCFLLVKAVHDVQDMTGSKGCGSIFPWIKDITVQWKAKLS